MSKELNALTDCHFLTLPVEIRLHIYAYVLESPGPRALTFGSLLLDGSTKDIIAYLKRERKIYRDVKPLHVPVVRDYYDDSLLSNKFRPTIDASSAVLNQDLSKLGCLQPRSALLRVSRSVRAEILDNWSAEELREATQLELHIEYPSGLGVFTEIGWHLLQDAKHLCVVGEHRDDLEAVDASEKLRPLLSYCAERQGTLKFTIYIIDTGPDACWTHSWRHTHIGEEDRNKTGHQAQWRLRTRRRRKDRWLNAGFSTFHNRWEEYRRFRLSSHPRVGDVA